MRIIVACEESQSVCIAFRSLGHEAYSCDIQDCSGGHPEWHLKGSIWDFVYGINNQKWDMMIGHPPCTFLSNAGNDYFNKLKYKDAYLRWLDRYLAAEFFMKMMKVPIKRICLENPVGWINGYYPPNQIIEPYYFGDSHKKRTCLWLKNLPKLIHQIDDDLFNEKTHVDVKPIYQFERNGKTRNIYFTDAISGTGKDAKKLRSKTFDGVSAAMSAQWCNLEV